MYVGAFQLHEALFKQVGTASSAVAGLYVETAEVPKNRIWTVLALSVYGSAAETRTWQLVRMFGGTYFGITMPQSVAITLNNYLAFITPGNELVLFPGEKLRVYRDAATAGSTITAQMLFVDSELPFFKYSEPQRELSKRRRSSVWPITSIIGGSRAAIGSHESEGGGVVGGDTSGPREEPV